MWNLASRGISIEHINDDEYPEQNLYPINRNEGCEQSYHYKRQSTPPKATPPKAEATATVRIVEPAVSYRPATRTQNELPRDVDYLSKLKCRAKILGDSGDETDELNSPVAAAYCAENDRIYVADAGLGRIVKFDLNSRRGKMFQRCHVNDLAFSSSGVLHTTQMPSVDSFLIDRPGKRYDSFTFGVEDSSLACYRNDIYILSDSKRHITVFDEDGRKLREFGRRYLIKPQKIAVANDLVYVTDSYSEGGSIVHVFTKYGCYQNSCCVTDVKNDASGICVDDDGFVSVARYTSGCVDVYDPDCELFCTIGKQGSGKGRLDQPMGLSLMPDGRLIVCDSGNGRVQIF